MSYLSPVGLSVKKHVALILALGFLICTSDARTVGSAKTNSQQLQKLGIDLRTALDQSMERIEAQSKFQFEVNIDSVVAKFIPVGLDLGNAETILKDAGMSVRHAKVHISNSSVPIVLGAADYPGNAFRKSFVQIAVYAKGEPIVVRKVTAVIRNTSL
jgi:hypothetical protein